MAEAPRFAAFWAGVPEWNRWARLVAAAGVGVLMGLGQDGGRAAWLLVLVGLILGFRAVQHLTWKQAAWVGWALGVGYFTYTLRWIVEPFFVDPWRHGWMAPFAILGMGGGLALFWAVAFGLSARLAAAPGPRFALLAALLIAGEYARAHVLSGFPWAMLSYATIGTPFDLLLAWVGPHGVSLILAGIAALAAYAFYRGWTLIWPGFVAMFAAVVGLAFVTPEAQRADPDGPVIRLVQPNAPQHLKWDPEWMPVFFDRAIAATGADPAPDLVIWPETSVPVLLNNADPWLAEIARVARGAPVIAGIQRYNPDAGYHNSLILLEDDGSVAQVYDKRHLVPFGEYVPLAWVLGKIGLTGVADMAQGFVPGAGAGTFDIPGLGRTRVLICYEGIFPEEIIEDGLRPDVLLIITNDAWFGTGPGPRQHLAQARARAIEFGIPVVRAANTGVSAIIDPRGRITASLALNETGHLDGRVPVVAPQTLYARTGDFPTLLLLGFVIASALVAARRFGVDLAPDGR